MSTFLISSSTSQSNSYPIVLTMPGGPRSRPNPHLKFVEVQEDRTRDLMISNQTLTPTRMNNHNGNYIFKTRSWRQLCDLLPLMDASIETINLKHRN